MILLLPFLPYILAGLAGLAGLSANWWLEFTDWPTAVVAAVALLACVFVLSTGKPWSRLAVLAIVGVAVYLKGGIDKEATLAVQHKAELDAVHQAYAKVSQAEQARQQEVQEAAARAAAALQEQQEAELADLRTQLDASAGAAAKDPHADRPALSLDAVRRINAQRMRGGAGS